MRLIIRLIGYAGVAATILPSLLFLGGKMELDSAKFVMVLATIVWFAAAIIIEWNLDKKYFNKSEK